MDNGISIIICCFNSASRISETLHAIFKLTVPDGMACELIVVNNNSNDNTAEVVERMVESFNRQSFLFRLVNEERAGLSFARMTGIKSSTFKTVIFCDDDNHLNHNYLLKTVEILKRDSQIGIIGGWAKPKFSIPPGKWIVDFYTSMAIGPQARADGYVSWVYGAGMVLKKEIFTKLEEKKIKLLLSDRSGNVLTSGGDSEICSLALFIGFKIHYSSDLVLMHAIPVHRLKKSHYMKARLNTIYPSLYLFLLDEAIHQDTDLKWRGLYSKKLFNSLRDMFYFAPRIFLGSHQFYSFFMFYRTGQTVVWLLLNKKTFENTFHLILANLSLDKK